MGLFHEIVAGLRSRCFVKTSNLFSFFFLQPNRPEIDLSIDQDLWAEDGRPERTVTRPLNKAPGEYPSPRKKGEQLSPVRKTFTYSRPCVGKLSYETSLRKKRNLL